MLGTQADLGSAWPWALLVVAGVGAGFINTVAGGGSLMTLPALMLLGLPANVANGSNRLAVVTQSVSGALAFHREGRLPVRAIGPVVVPTALGAACGALAAAWTPEAVIEPVLLSVLVVMATLMVARPKLVVPDADAEPVTLRERPAAALGLFGAGLYGGFIQAGVGFVLLAVIAGALRRDLVHANALKLVGTTLFGVIALAIFVGFGQVEWGPAVVLAVATVIGSRLGVRFAVKARPEVLRVVVFVAVVSSVVAILLR